ncbi:MAG TPA: hypothetical protein VJC13_00815 [Candidatus Paceibacterota bacterium]
MTISIDDFKKLEIKIGQILSVEKVPDTDKLLKLSVDMGPSFAKATEGKEERDIRQIISGISAFFPDPQILVGKKCAFAANLESRVIRGFQSQGMILAVNGDGLFSLLETNADIAAGSVVK